jgi:hypothetical protein
MASESSKTLQGHRLVAGQIEDVDCPQVVAVRDLGAALGAVFAGALLLSLAAAVFVVHGLALICPPLAAAVGGAWGYLVYRSAIRRSAPSFPPLPASAVIVPVSGPTVTIIMRVTFVAGSIAAVIIGLGHGSPPAMAAGACVLPLLYTHTMIVALFGRRSAIRHARDDGERVVYQTLGQGKKQPARLYSADGWHAG